MAFLPLTLVVALLFGIAELPGSTVVAAEREQGRALYNSHCYFCHGYSGDARTLAARFLQPPPRDFTATSPVSLPRVAMIDAVTHGRASTAMTAYAGLLSREQIAAVVDFIRSGFMEKVQLNTRYHTTANGWPDHDRYARAFPFATGKIALDTPLRSLTPSEQAGRRLFLTSCISCHDRSHVTQPGIFWEREAVTYPLFQYEAQRQPDPVNGADAGGAFARHNIPPHIPGLTAQELRGEALFQANCAFCHAADGTGKNWIGSFLQPHPRNLTDPTAMAGKDRADLRRIIREGLPGTSMPAWRVVLNSGDIDAVISYVSRAFHRIEPDPDGTEIR